MLDGIARPPADARRHALTGPLACVLAGSVALLGACTQEEGAPPDATSTAAQSSASPPSGHGGGTPGRTTPTPSRDQQVAAAAARRVVDLLALVEATAARHPGLRLTALREVHEAQLRALAAAAGPLAPTLRPGPPPVPATTAAPTGAPAGDAPTPEVAPAVRAARAALARAELSAAQGQLAGAGIAGGSLAALLTSIGAATTGAAVALGAPPPPVQALDELPDATAADPGGEPVDALQAELAARHAAVWGYGVAGALAPEDRRDEALADWARHRARRDALGLRLVAAGAEPVAAEPAYDLPFPVGGPADALRLAQQLEQAVAAAALEGVAADGGGREATEVVRSAELARLRWGGSLQPFAGGQAPP